MIREEPVLFKFLLGIEINPSTIPYTLITYNISWIMCINLVLHAQIPFYLKKKYGLTGGENSIEF